MTATSPTTPARPSSASANGRARAGGRTTVTTAVLLATARTDTGGPAAAQGWDETTVLRRLVDQLADIGVAEIHVVTRQGWEEQLAAAVEGSGATVHASRSPAADLRLVADVAGASGEGGVLVAYGDIVTHREALAGVLADPRVASGILASGGRRWFTYRARTSRGRLVSAGSPYHLVHRSTTNFLGVLKVSAADRVRLVEAARQLEQHLAGDAVPERWQEELERKIGNMRVRLATSVSEADDTDEEGRDDPEDDLAIPDRAEPVRLDPADVVLSDELEAIAGFRRDVAEQDVVSLLLVGLVRSGASLATGHLRKLFWARPLSSESIERAREKILEYDEEKVLLDSAVKATDGFFTTFFVSPYSKYIARWCARLGLTPNQVTTFSVLLGFAAAAAFATGERWGLITGAILLQLAFTTDCVDGQLARYTRTFTKLGAWLDSVFDRTKEYAVFAGLAIGATQMGEPAWTLALAALTLQTVRHTFDFSYAAAQHEVIGATPQTPLEDPSDVPGRGRPRTVAAPSAAPVVPTAPDEARTEEPAQRQPLPRRILQLWRRLDRLPAVPWVKRMVAFPIGERFAAISITAAIWSPKVTFIVLLAWGGFAAAYSLAGRLLRSVSR